MTRNELAEKVNEILVELCGEQFGRWTDEDGDFRFDLCIRGVPIGLAVEQLSRRGGAVLMGHHVVGARVEDEDAATRFVAAHNHRRIRFGRLDVRGQDVVFFDHLFSAAVNKDSVRALLGLLASESRSYADLAEAAGALRLADLAAIDGVDGD